MKLVKKSKLTSPAVVKKMIFADGLTEADVARHLDIGYSWFRTKIANGLTKSEMKTVKSAMKLAKQQKKEID